jgi:DNA-binding protein Fis
LGDKEVDIFNPQDRLRRLRLRKVCRQTLKSATLPLQSAMQRHKGNKTHVAQELGLTRLGLRMKLQRLGLE